MYVYYQLKNFYQNHRTYVKSRSDKQLLGTELEKDEMDDCLPRKYAKVRASARRRPPLRRGSARGENICDACAAAAAQRREEAALAVRSRRELAL